MRGTAIKTNRAITSPVLVFGCERKLFTITIMLGAWFFISALPHLMALLILVLVALSVWFLRFIAKQDPQAALIFKSNSKFLIGKGGYVAKADACQKPEESTLVSVPIALIRKI
jgi:type IV secretory pathway TrbD component